METRTCPHCGAPVPEGAVFCPVCASDIHPRQAAGPPAPLRRKLLLGLLALALLAAAWCAWAFLRPAPSGFPAGEQTTVTLYEDENGMVKVTPDLLRAYFPMLTGINFSTTSQTAEGEWQIDVTACDYDFTDLYEEQLAAFEAGWEDTFSTCIPPEEIEGSGAAWFLNGYNTGRGPVLREDDAQLYHLWAMLNSPEPERQCREIQRLGEFLPNEGRWRCYLLLDKDYNLLGYTMLDWQGEGG